MKKGAILTIVLILVIAVGSIGAYTYLNTLFKKKAEQKIEKIVKQSNTIKNLYYKNLTTNFLLDKITFKDAEMEIENNGQVTGKILIKEATLQGNLTNNYKAKFKDAKLVNLNSEAPIELMGKTILTAKNGEIELKDNKKETKYNFSIKDIQFSYDFFKNLENKNKEIKNILTNILQIKNPINIEAEMTANKEQETFKVKNYQINWKNSFLFNYSMKLKNINFEKLKNIAKELNKEQKNPFFILQLFGELSKIKPVKLKFELKDEGIKERIFNFLNTKDNITANKFANMMEIKLKNTPFYMYTRPIVNFIKTNDGKIELTIENPNNLSIGDILQNTKELSDINKILKIKLTN